jgi:hypothetical protein
MAKNNINRKLVGFVYDIARGVRVGAKTRAKTVRSYTCRYKALEVSDDDISASLNALFPWRKEETEGSGTIFIILDHQLLLQAELSPKIPSSICRSNNL